MKLEQIITLGENLSLNRGDMTVPTKLQELMPEGRLLVSYPTYQSVPVHLHRGETVQLSFSRPNGLHTFSAVVEGRRMQDNVLMCVLKATSAVSREQRRSGYRLEVSLDMSFAVLENDPEPTDQSLHIRTHSLNLSETGALFTSQVPMSPGTRLLLMLRLGVSELVKVEAEVVRCQPPEHAGDPWIIAVHFGAAGARDRISRYVLKRQILQRHAKEVE